jgi:hypothetical protein
MSNLPKISNYGRYSSDNYGAHTLCVSVGTVDMYFSYKTLVAFRTPDTGLVVGENVYSPTTGKHLNWIDGGKTAKKDRLDRSEFESKWAEVSERFEITLA